MPTAGLSITTSDPQSGRITALSSDGPYSHRPDSGFFEEVGLLILKGTGVLARFRERISVEIEDDGNVRVHSISEPSTVILDQGRNRKHVLTLWKALDEVLLPNGLQIIRDRYGRPGLADVDGEIIRVDLNVSMDQVVSDPALAAVAQQRLDEARLCHCSGAYTATIIMLGSLLEGVLVSAVGERLAGQPPKPLDRMGLQDLIALAHREGWIQVDVKMGSELIRMYRNLVHPRAQIRMGDPPDSDTVDICWPIVNATLNDLAATAPRP
ncbi:MAG: hypothetical protein JO345_33160 [Streptosporangiaceae bacterium]|nr:hypothetical protein [Streptosporangiaceae bacterium]